MGARERIRLALRIDAEKVAEELMRFIRRKVEGADATGAVLGLSGGVDSSTTAALCARALGGDRVLGICAPEVGVTDPRSVADAERIARMFGIDFKVVDVTPMIRSVSSNIPDFETDALIPAANLKPRIRMTVLYYYANLLNRLVVGTGNRSELRAGYFCYDAQTRAFTTKGLKDHTQLKPGDIVLSLNSETGKVEERPIAGVYRFNYEGDMVRFLGKRTDLMVTPNHRMLVSRRDGSLAFKPAEECFGRRIDLPIPAPWDGRVSAPSSIDLNRFYDQSQLPWNAKRIRPMLTCEFLYLLGLFIGDGTAYQGRTEVPIKAGLDQHQYASSYRDEKGRFVALSDTNEGYKEYDTYEIFFAIPLGDRARQPLERILSRNKINYSSTPDVVRVHSRAFFEAFRACGHGAHQKRIPRWVFQYPAEELEWLFRGLVDSDGGAARGTYYTSSYQLALDFVEICAKTGRHATIYVRPPRETTYGWKKIKSDVAYDVFFTRHITHTSIYPGNARKVHYTGIVWCPDVPVTHNLLVERNGKFAFCGNTKYGDGGVDILPLGCLYKTQVKQLAAHLGIPEPIINKVPSAGLWPGQTDEGELGLPYEKLDLIYVGLDLGLGAAEIAEAAGVKEEDVIRLIEREKKIIHKLEPPSIPTLA